MKKKHKKFDRKEILQIFTNEQSKFDPEISWLILSFAGIVGSGHYSMFFWVFVS